MATQSSYIDNNRAALTKFAYVNGYLWIALSMLDGLVTIYLVGAGHSEELNPVMAQLLGWGPIWFFLIKTIFLTVVPIVLVTRLVTKVKSSSIGRVRAYITSLSAIYIGLIIYEAILVWSTVWL